MYGSDGGAGRMGRSDDLITRADTHRQLRQNQSIGAASDAYGIAGAYRGSHAVFETGYFWTQDIFAAIHHACDRRNDSVAMRASLGARIGQGNRDPQCVAYAHAKNIQPLGNNSLVTPLMTSDGAQPMSCDFGGLQCSTHERNRSKSLFKD
jgi:hypothetical protein